MIVEAECNGGLGRGDTLAFDEEGEPLCDDHPELVDSVGAGIYAHGGGTPCEPNNRAFRVEDVTPIERKGLLDKAKEVLGLA